MFTLSVDGTDTWCPDYAAYSGQLPNWGQFKIARTGTLHSHCTYMAIEL